MHGTGARTNNPPPSLSLPSLPHATGTRLGTRLGTRECRFWPRKRDVFSREVHFLFYALALSPSLTGKPALLLKTRDFPGKGEKNKHRHNFIMFLVIFPALPVYYKTQHLKPALHCHSFVTGS